MAAESMLSVVQSLHTAEQSWCIWLKEMGAGDYQQTANCLFSILGWLGQRSIENLIASVAPPSEFISYLKFSLSKHVSYVLSYSAGIFTKYNRFPYQETSINEWFTHSAEGVPRDQAVNIINVDKDGQTRKCYKTQNQVDDFPEALEDFECEIFFHGTKHRSAEDIIEGGINLKKGDEKKDFSDRDGFYVSKNFDEAFEWTGKRRYPSSAVLVFRVKKSELRDYNGLNLRDHGDEWQDVISKFRSGKANRIHRSYHFIEGPMASVSRNNPRFEYPVQKYGSYQLCVRNVNCAELFDRSLHSVVFFDR
ncbi:hypothetical protein OS493_037283 [Desmophyllum pertusum]|uniref:DUF3990 domain-containing protein n=1 Tax=Desmophyllum pertusum TaxID=174260 RepID=A0A9W9Y783_9CNID|nr:hypothetical protein OS493_037283 [Desmophyllum pertusum]